MFNVTNDKKNFIYGALTGVGVSAVGFYLYKKNQDKVNQKLKKYGIDIPTSYDANYKDMSIEELMENKESLEDLIAEKELENDSLQETEE